MGDKTTLVIIVHRSYIYYIRILRVYYDGVGRTTAKPYLIPICSAIIRFVYTVPTSHGVHNLRACWVNGKIQRSPT